MDSSYSTPSRRSYDLPKPDTGLAEWTSKIKAMQKQVDDDDENEQKRLEEEIAAARQARLRRSFGSGGGSRVDRADLSNSLRGQLEIPNIPNDNSANDTAKSILETRNDREAALRKLMDRNSVYNPDKVRDLNIGSKNEPVSLASFVGGRATAPRLNRHAPQADANDSTQYIQPDLTAPHPVFGTGGVAIPGMTSKRESKSPIPFVGSEQSERYRPSSANTKSSPSPIPVPGVGKAAEPSKRMNTDINRRSFTAIHKSPSPALAQRYTEKLDDSATRDAKLGPDLAKRKSISKSSSLLSSPTTEENSLTPIGMSPSKSADDYRSISATSSSWKSSPVVSSSLSSSKGERPAPSILASATKMKPTTSIGSSTLSYGGTSVLTSSSSSKPIKTHSYPTTPSSDHRSLLSYDSPSYAVSTAKKDDTPLRRLMERNHVHNPDKGAAENSRKSVVERAQTTSLAAFMGGSGKGIRLNKHAPQVDAHDPTQFVQPDLNTPHPVFGKGGVAMPGMITRKSAPDARSRADNADLSTPASTKKAIWPPIYSAEKTEERPVSPQKSGGRARTNSVPRLESSVGFGGSQANSWRSHATERLQSPTKETRDTPFRDRTISTPSTAQHSVVTPSLARPLQPTSKAFSLSPQVPVITASPAFKNPISQKDLTPSLSRLQGRGFVQNMVKASSHISNTPPSPTPPPTRPTSATGKKGLVSDRWQQNVQPNSPTKSLTTPSALKGSSSTSNLEASHSLKSTASLPSFGKLAVSTPSPQPAESRAHLDPYQRSHTPGLGSATTMVVIKPSKSFTDLSEMGMKNGHGDIAQFSNLDSTPSRKPPIHLRRRKSQDGHDSCTFTGANPQPLAESLTQERREVDAIAPRSAPASIETFSYISRRSGFNILSSLETSRAETKVEMADRSTPVHSPFNGLPEEKEPEVVGPSLPPLTVATQQTKERESSLLPPFQHVRIPSTGTRLTAMEVAQALSESPREEEKQDLFSASPATPEAVTSVSRPRLSPLPQIQAEKRRSNYEKYSAITLPPLKEEATPTPSPVGTLKRAPVGLHEDNTSFYVPEKNQAPEQDDKLAPQEMTMEIIHLPYNVGPSISLDNVKVSELLKSRPRPSSNADDIQTISVDVFSIIGNAATLISKSPDIFYDTEILAIVHRVKSGASGLATTTVWCWLGKHTCLGDREEKKLKELANRYGTSARIFHQLAEPVDLVMLLGGCLAIRQGTRNHWTSENTTMHLVRSFNGVVLIDEHDFSIKNLCSAFSYCFTVLGSIYVWHGCGSTPREREVAMEYAQRLSPDAANPIELFEGENDEDEVFWMILGDDDFAKADYWRWRHNCVEPDPMIWRIERRNVMPPVVPIDFISMDQNIHDSVYVICCVWELFVLVGKDARADREAIRVALDLAKKLSTETAFVRPYKPTIHVLILPSRLPIDLRLGIRDLDEAHLNNGDIPDHMNLITCSEADVHLKKYSWERASLKDCNMLPLGVDPAALT